MPSYSVRTLDGDSFADACASLLQLVEKTYRPDLLVGIRTGGLVVAEAMIRATGQQLTIAPLTCRRPGTQAKSQSMALRLLLRALPRQINNLLRVLEVRLLSSRRRRKDVQQSVDRTEAAAIGKSTGHNGAMRLLVVDDAVDSGVTLATVMRELRAICPPETEIRSAAITVTLNNPVAEPDFSLYRHVVCRFPWSFDAA